MYRIITLFASALLTLGASARACADVITVLGNTGDGTIDVTGLPQDFNLSPIRAGVGGNDLRGLAPVFFFELPTLTTQSALQGAELKLQFLDVTRATIFTAPEFKADLFGIGARSSPTILSTDYFDGNSALSKDTLIAKGFVTRMALA